ncbi:hypothetical protein BLOT_014710 [Blomia tropicalis]|nr:hypothetical protein BLOT_014710 [Blomia tropicalis]
MMHSYANSMDTRIIKRYIIFQKICMTIWTLRAIQPCQSGCEYWHNRPVACFDVSPNSSTIDNWVHHLSRN